MIATPHDYTADGLFLTHHDAAGTGSMREAMDFTARHAPRPLSCDDLLETAAGLLYLAVAVRRSQARAGTEYFSVV